MSHSPAPSVLTSRRDKKPFPSQNDFLLKLIAFRANFAYNVKSCPQVDSL
jgi:hypothetical protein